MQRTAERTSVLARRSREIPVYQNTECAVCGADQRVAVRYRDTVLCLDCYRQAQRENRALSARMEQALRIASAADPTSVVARRFARLCSLSPARHTRTAPRRSRHRLFARARASHASDAAAETARGGNVVYAAVGGRK